MNTIDEIMRDAIRDAFREDPWLQVGGVFPPESLIQRVAQQATAVAVAYEAGEYAE